MSLDERGTETWQPRLDLARVEVLTARQRTLPEHVRADLLWPCPACGLRQPVRSSWALRVRNSDHPPHEREVIACDDCARRVGAGLVDR